eukprot:scaffold482_cov266-Amphora_coffeaeformis.AAC.20
MLWTKRFTLVPNCGRHRQTTVCATTTTSNDDDDDDDDLENMTGHTEHEGGNKRTNELTD